MPYQVRTRVDYIILSTKSIKQAQSSEIGTSETGTWSDHAWVSCTFLAEMKRQHKHTDLILNTLLLLKDQVQQQITTTITNYFEDNKTCGVST